MPNSRRRRFSVHNGIAGRDHCKAPTSLQTSAPQSEPEVKTIANNLMTIKSKSNKMQPNSSKNSNSLEIIADCASSVSMLVKKRSTATEDKDVTASSSNIDLFNIMNATDEIPDPLKETDKKESQKRDKREPSTRDKYPRQHRIKVRSPKRRPIPDSPSNQPKTNDNRHTVGTEAIDWSKEVEVCVYNSVNVVESTEDEGRHSNHSLDDMCRICHGGDSLSGELGPLVSACSCRGTVGRVHVKCLERWLTESGKSRCELCGTRYATRRVHRYGVPRALILWILSHNAKQLMVDSLGIMLMSPLAVLAAWLSGRTLAGLMMQDSHVTPWPLASTFVLACMTLVCYYCWIVSAATRHALGWWVWYRSQYEVRLTLDDEDQ